MSIIIDLSRFFYDNFTIFWFFALSLGSWSVFTQIFRFLHFLYAKLIRKRKNLSEIYGKDTWALITGSSEGTSHIYVSNNFRYW
jgi:hypothetical protein